MTATAPTAIRRRELPRLDAGPILAAVRSAGHASQLDPGNRRAYHRAQAEGTVTVFAADRLAIALGLHPAQVWGAQVWINAAAS